jgi:glucokinase
VTPPGPSATAASTIGVDIGGTKCLGVVLDAAGHVAASHRVPTPRPGAGIVEAIAEIVQALGGAGRVPVGIGAPGLVDGRGNLRFAPNLPGIVELPLGDLVRARLPGNAVVVDNDATCAVWAEHLTGAAVGRRDVLLATIGTGIGGGLVAGGTLLRGAHGFAGEIGHMVVDPGGPSCVCGRSGCWERYASGAGLGWMGREAAQAGTARRVVELAGGDPEAVRGEHVTAAVAEGDEQAHAVMARFAWWLALGLANLATIVDPELIVLGGGMVGAGPALLDPARRAFEELLEGAAHRPPIPVVAAALGEGAGAVGAALLARDQP